MGLGKHYSLFCTESTLESFFFIRKRENVVVKGERLIFWEKRQFFKLTTKKERSSEFFAWKIGNFSGKSEIFWLELKIFAIGFMTPRLRTRLAPLHGCPHF